MTLSRLVALPADSPLWRWQPDMRYHLVDERAFAPADLAGRDSLVALLFRLETEREADQVVAAVDAVIDWFRRHSGFEALMPMFAALAFRVVEMAEGAAPGVLVSENLLEVRTMLATRAAEWRRQWRLEARQEGLQEGRQEGLQAGRQEGLQEGRQEGLQEGLRKGEAAVLTRLLERRFGTLSDEIVSRIGAADTATLEEWTLRVLDASSIADVMP